MFPRPLLECQVTCDDDGLVNVARLLEDSASLHPARPAVHLLDGEVSYGQLRERALAVAARLQEHGTKPGDRVALKLPNGTDFVASYFGILRLGAIAVPLNVLLSPREVADRLARSTPRFFLVDEAGERAVGEAARAVGVEVLAVEETAAIDVQKTQARCKRSDADAAVILFTSGTTGAAKGAVLTHGSIRTAALNAGVALELAPADVMLGAAPFSHVLGQATGILSTVSAGAAIAVVPRFEAADTLRFMAETATTIVLGVPAMCITLCRAARKADHPLPPVRIGHVGGAPVPQELAREFERTFGAKVREGYGLTEMSGIATTSMPGEERRPGSVGRPLGGTELRVVSAACEPLPPGDTGEVQFRGRSVFAGYWRDEHATREALSPDGWLSTGDMGYVDEDGYLFLVDRKKEMIIRGGYNIYPRELEEVLYTHPGVVEAAVVGVPHDVLGEEVAAVVVAAPGSAVTAEALQDHVKERVALYKYPRQIVFVDALPKGPTGKILKRSIDMTQLLATVEQR
jgi:long-chain acyl-CoA synthetase